MDVSALQAITAAFLIVHSAALLGLAVMLRRMIQALEVEIDFLISATHLREMDVAPGDPAGGESDRS